MICCVIFGINNTRDISKLSQITYKNFEIWPVVFMPSITTNHAITYINQDVFSSLNFTSIKCVSEPFLVLSQTEMSYFPPFHIFHNQWNPNHFLYPKPEKRYTFLKGFLYFSEVVIVSIGRNIVLLIHKGKHSRSKKNINTFLYFFKWDIKILNRLYCTVALWKTYTSSENPNKCKSKKTYTAQ